MPVLTPMGVATMGAGRRARVLLHSARDAGFSTASTTYYGAFQGVIPAATANTTEANVQVVYRGPPAVISKFRVLVSSNARTTDTVITVRKNGADTGLTVTFASGVTGSQTQLMAQAPIFDGDTLNYSIATGSGAGTILISGIAAEMLLPAGEQAFIQLTPHMNDTQSTAGATNYMSFLPASGGNTTEANRRMVILETAILSRFQVIISANTRPDDTVYTVRKNNVDTGITLTIGAGLTGRFEDAVNTLAVAVGDVITMGQTLGAGAGSITTSLLSIKHRGTVPNRHPMYGGGGPNGVAAGATRYAAFGSRSNAATAEADVRLPVPFEATLSNLRVWTTLNTNTSTTPFNLRKNNANGNQSASIDIGGTGASGYADLVNTDRISEGDTINVVNGTIAAGSVNFLGFGVLVST